MLLRGFDLQAVNYYLNIVLDLLLELGRIAELMGLSIHSHAGITLSRQVLEKIHKLALALTHYRCKHLEFQLFFQIQHRIHNLLRRLALNHRIALWAVRRTSTGKEQAQVVVDLRDRAHRRTWIMVGGFLINGHRG